MNEIDVPGIMDIYTTEELLKEIARRSDAEIKEVPPKKGCNFPPNAYKRLAIIVNMDDLFK